MTPSLTIVRYKLGGRVHGPVEVAQLRKLPGFMLSTPVAPIESDSWKPAFEVINLSDYFGNKKPSSGAPIDPGLGEALESISAAVPFSAPIEQPQMEQPRLEQPPLEEPRSEVQLDPHPSSLPKRANYSKVKWLMAVLLMTGVTAYAGMTWVHTRAELPTPITVVTPEPLIEPVVPAAVVPPPQPQVVPPAKPAAPVIKHHHTSHKHHKKHHS